MTESDINQTEAISLYLETLSITKVAERYGCHCEKIRRILIKNGIARKKRNYTKPSERKTRIYPTDEEILVCYEECGCNQKLTAEMLNVSQAFINRHLKNYDVVRGGDRGHCRKISDEEILKYTRTMTREEISEKFNIHIATLDRRMGALRVHAIRKPSNAVDTSQVWKFRKGHNNIVNERQSGFIYIESTRDRIKMMCSECGTVIDRASSTVRQKHCECDICKERKKQAELLVKALSALITLKTPRTCKECGSVFFSMHQTAQYCSKACKSRRNNRNSYKARCRHRGALYDNTVTREKVVERDNCICQICGKTCDPTDRRWGTLGPDFPTLDHIIALANGGTHTWDNVQCACGMCNSKKRDLIDWRCVV